MSKYLLIFFFIFFNILQSVKSLDIAPYLLRFFEGWTLNGKESKCYSIIDQNKEFLSDTIYEIFNNIRNKTAIESLLRVQGFKVIKIPKFLKICDIGTFIKIYITLSSEKGIEQLGNTLNKTSLRIFNSLTQNIDKNEDIFKIIGNVTNIIFDVEAE